MKTNKKSLISKNSLLITVLLISLAFYPFFSPVHRVEAWGLPTHQFIVENALLLLPPEWQEVFTLYRADLIGGSMAPDTWGDTENHLYHVQTGYGSAPETITHWLGQMAKALDEGRYSEGIWAAGIMAHYFSDINTPIHTDSYWEGHSAFEKDVNNNLDIFELSLENATLVNEPEQFSKNAATNAHLYYSIIRSNYPSDTTSGPVESDPLIKDAVETQLSSTISGVASLWLTAIQNQLPPFVEFKKDSGIVRLDLGHQNDYDEDLSSFSNYLESIGFVVIRDSDGLTTTDLDNTDFLIITALGTTYSSKELDALKTWVSSPGKMIFITGRGDYTTSINHAAINNVLLNLGTSLRMNDDNIYTVVGDPNFYKEWYIYSENFLLPNSSTKPSGITLLHFFSPNSLYFDGDMSRVQVIANGSKYDYQRDESSPGIQHVYDNTGDGVGGEKIPIIATQVLSQGNKIVVFGDTTFSDFSFSQSSLHQDMAYVKRIVEWVTDNRSNPALLLPNMVIENALNNTQVTSKSVTVNYQVSANVVRVELLVDNQTVATTNSTLSFGNFTFDLALGTHKISLRGYNTAGKTIERSFFIERVSEDISHETTQKTTTTTTRTSQAQTPIPIIPILLALLLFSVKRLKRLKSFKQQ